MNKQQAAQLLRLRENGDAVVFFGLLKESEDKAVTALRKRNESIEIYRAQGELRVHDQVDQLFDEARKLLEAEAAHQQYHQ